MSIRAIHRIAAALACMPVLLAFGLPALADPDISVSPTSLSESLLTGGSVTRTLRISNTGGSDLSFDLTAQATVLATTSGRGLRDEGLEPPEGMKGTDLTLAGTYSGASLAFGITDYGEVMPFQSPIGNEHLAVGSWISGYTVAYVSGGSDRIAYTLTGDRSRITPISYREIRNTAAIAEIEVVTGTTDGVLKITQRFVFSKSTNYFTVTAEITNLLGSPVTDVVFKRATDWDVDGDFLDDDDWDYDTGRNMVVAWDQTYVAMAGVETPLFMDIYGWNDMDHRDTVVDIPSGPVSNFDGLEILHFDLGNLGAHGSRAIHAVYAAGSSLAELQQGIDRGRALATWLSFDHTTGTVPAGGYQDILVTFDATGLYGGEYDAQIVVASNDPDEAEVTVPVHLHVTGVTDIEVTPGALNYGSVFVGGSSTKTVTVANVGTDVLTVTSVASDHGDFSSDASSFTLGTGQTRDLTITYRPSGAGSVASTLRIVSNDPDENEVVVSLAGQGLIAQDISVSPTSLSESLFTGGSVTRALRISNTGGSDLSFDLSIGAAGLAAAPGRALRRDPGLPPPEGVKGADVTPASGSYSGTSLAFGITNYGEVMPFQYPIGNEDLAVGGWVSGYTLAYTAGGSDRIAYTVHDSRLGIAPISYTEIRNTPAVAEIEVVTGTTDGVLRITQLFVFSKSTKFFTVTAEITNLTGVPVSNIVFKRAADWDADGDYSDDGWDYDTGRNMVVAWDQTYVAMAGVETPLVMDLDGWEDLYRRATAPYPYAPVYGYDGLEILHFDLGTLDPDESTTNRTVYAAGSSLAELQEGIDRGRALVSWLSLDPTNGTVPAGGYRDILVTFDAAGLTGGDYDAQIVVTSNDPDEAEVTVPVHLDVTGVADIGVTPGALNYGSVFVGSSSTKTITVANAGTDVLTVTSIASDHGDFSSDASSFTLGIGEARDLTITYRPSGAGSVASTLRIVSNDPDENEVVVSLAGQGLIPPDISVSPTSLSESLFTGGSVTRALRITNTGGSDLSFTVDIENGSAMTPSGTLTAGTRSDVAPATGTTGPAVAESQMAGADVLLLQSLAPWGTSSNEQILAANGIAYDRIGSGSLPGTNLAPYRLLIVASDQTTSFYNALATQMSRIEAWVAAGGVLEFHAASGGWNGGDNSALTLPRGMRMYRRYADYNYVLDPTHPLVAGVASTILGTAASHTSFSEIPADASLIVSDDSGQPNLVVYRHGLGTVLAGGQTFEFGLAYGQDAGQILVNMIPYAHGQQPRWLSVNSAGGVVPAGGSVDLSVTFDATGLDGGEYDAQIVVTSNDPDEEEVTVPVHLHVTGVADIDVTPAGLDYGSVFVGSSSTRTVSITNVGTDLLTVTSVEADHGDFSSDVMSFTLGVRETRDVTITYSPSGAGSIATTLRIKSNDPDEPEALVSLAGQALIPPDVSVSPTSLSESLFTGGTVTRTLRIANPGGSDLSFELGIQGTAWAPASAPALPSVRAGTDVTPAAGTYSGTSLAFGITNYGEVMPFQHPIGNEHLAVGNWYSGYTLAYVAAGSDHVVYTLYNDRLGITPISYREIRNTTAVAEIEVVTGTTDGVLRITQRFVFSKSTKYLTVTAEIMNLTGAPLSNVVFKRAADWDVDADYPDDSWDYDTGRNMVVAWDQTYVAMAGVETPLFMDIHGWDDITRRDTFVDFPQGPVFGHDGLELLHFDLGTLDAHKSTRIATAYAAGSSLAELQQGIDRGRALASWLTYDPTNGTVPAGGYQDILVTFDATGLNGGDYDAQIVVTSNDPDEAEVTIPVHLHVTGVTDIEVTPADLDFGPVFVGSSSTKTITVANVGTDVLTVTSVASDHGDFSSNVSSFTLGIGATLDIAITYRPSAAVPIASTLRIVSNDPDEPEALVPLAGRGLIPPDVSVSPASLSESLFTGGSVTRALRITNTGGSDLNFNLRAGAGGLAARTLVGAPRAPRLRREQQPSPPAALERYGSGRAPAREPLVAVAAPQIAGNFAVLIIHSGGDVNEIRTFLGSFGDISAVDAFDAQYQTPSPAQLTAYRAVIVSGYVPFSNPFGLGNVLADYVDGGGGVVLTVPSYVQQWSVGGRFVSDGYLPIVNAFGPVADASLGSFDATHPIMHGVTSAWGDVLATGSVAADAELVASWSNGLPFVATKGPHVAAVNVFVGAPGYWTGDIPLILHNAVFWSTSVPWLSVDADSGVVPAGGYLDILVTFDATGMNGGDYDAQLAVTSNDPDEEEVAVPVHLHVTGVADIDVTPGALSYGPVFVGGSSTRTVSVENVGTDVLSVTSVASDHADFSSDVSSFSLGIGETRNVTITYRPSAAGSIASTLRIKSNDPDESEVLVSLAGQGLIPPDVSVSPTSLSESLSTGESVTRALRITNTGGSDLIFTVGIENGAAITPPAIGLTAGTRSDAAPATGVPGPTVVESRMVGADVLLVQEEAPWATTSNEQILAANGIAFDKMGVGSLAGTNLAPYRLLIVASDQTTSFYNALATQLSRIEAWVAAGGVLEFHAASGGWNAGDNSALTLPRGMRMFRRYADYNDVLDPTHPLVAGVSDPIYGTSASHTSFTNIPADASLVASDAFGQPNLVVYRHGRGTVVAGGQTFEFGFAYGQDAGQILANMIPYAYGQQPRWLTVNSPGGVVPAGGSVDLLVTFDATGLEGGEYDGEIVVTSNDPDHPDLPVHAHLHVRCTGTPTQCAPVAVCNDVTVAADAHCAGHVTAGQIDAGSHDPNGLPLTLTLDSAGPFGLGATTVTLTVTNSDDVSSTCQSAVTVADLTPPTLSVQVHPETLWQPNHTMVPIDAVAGATDNCGGVSIVLSSVVSNEADDGADDGSTINDIAQVEPGTADFHFALRAERAGSGLGRIYTVSYEATDLAGNKRLTDAHVVVPHDLGAVDTLHIGVDQTAAGTRVSWTPNPAVVSYDVVRGRLSAIRETSVVVDLGPVTCIAQDAPGSSTPNRDPAMPAPGELFFYLVEYDDGTSTSYGRGTSKPRTPGPGTCD